VTDLAAGLAAVQRAYREGLRPLLGVPWRTGRSHEGNIWARTGTQEDWKDDFPAGSMRTGELAAEVCDSHNAVLDLARLAKAGFDVTLSWRSGTWRAELPGPGGAMVMCGQGISPGEALAKARQWAEGEGAAP
jgi:hypothetical protein